MKRFVQFTKDLICNQYSSLLQKIAREKIPCAFFSPIIPLEQRISVIENLQTMGIDLKYLIVTDENSAPPPRKIIELVPFDQIDKINVRFVLSFGFDPAIRAALAFHEKFVALGIEMIMLSPSPELSSKYFEAISTHLTELFEIYSTLQDDASRETFLGYMLGRVSQKINFVRFDPAPQYFLSGFLPEEGDVVIDGGAMDGATAAMFSDLGCRVYSFEMNRDIFLQTKKLAEEKNFTLESFGLGTHRHEMTYLPGSGGGSKFVDSTDNKNLPIAEIISIDEYVREKKLPRIDFIKLDVEGSELDTLKGAAQTILRFKPILAISAYHKPDDLWTLFQFLKKIRPDYEFAVRQYSTDYLTGKYVFDNIPDPKIDLKKFLESFGIYPSLPYFLECVLYAK